MITGERRSGHLRNPSSWNRYAYALGDPINRNDRTGRCASILNGVTQTPFNSPATQAYAGSINAVNVYPYAGDTLVESLATVANESAGGLNTTASGVAALGVGYAISKSSNGQITLYLFSGGAQAANAAWQSGQIDQASIAYVVYVSPGFGPGQDGNILTGTAGTYWISNPGSLTDYMVNLGQGTTGSLPGVDEYFTTSCDHDFACVAYEYSDFFCSLNRGQYLLSWPFCGGAR